MFGRKQKLTVILVFIFISLISLFLFMRMEDRKQLNYFQDLKVAFELITELTADSISSAYCRWDDLYNSLRKEDSSAIRSIQSDIISDYHYIDSISFMDETPSFDHKKYRIYTVSNSLYIDFRIYNDNGSASLDNKVMTVKLDSIRMLSDIKGRNKFSFSAHREVYGYFFNKRVYSLSPLLRPYQIFASLLLGFFFAFWTKKSLCGISGFFYRSRGLNKLVSIFEHAERYSASHSMNVAAIAEKLGSELGLRRKSLKDLKIAALFHDIGKIAVPISILNKKGSLTSEEFEVVKKHTADSAEIIQEFEELAHLSVYIRHHHEKMDGSGYPSGLKGEEIPLFSRIIAVADIFDALVGERPYRKPMAPRKALRLMETEMSLDPVILTVLKINFDAILRLLKIEETLPFSA